MAKPASIITMTPAITQFLLLRLKNNVCKDISFSDSIHNDDQFVFKKIDESTTTSFVVGSSVIDVTVIIKSTLVLNNLNTTQSNSIQQYKTVSLLI